ncbi:amino acid/amide ABC transporter ATP-binding protein 2, HAAT family (TC 3.A.1.4.-) [Desulfacinum hydrothermale DSM 13146]|uniref:Amino acid/amide ABC transporter ATP-binding protein 2, HAAT family (TC 3.A.1.4.-) n=1 Tax=Desulfacinum hydrothermale DSM 13146 TaxID=1121390 RepID=A0A1W1XJP8_9BACT|nr:ABC transporter ATP-binding protein [Desulfacinum hydrothermale]SMC24027.1 amino acid/amide ABC transporter ATP-binding protein 2, HAAT family (TC 3.A.1.4.-) [Desulfacinum hydrothermale DSM 13146]
MLLGIKELDAGYGDVQVLWGLNLKVEEKQIVALVGSNGAGKSTLLKVISGLMRPYRGQILFRGEDITRTPPKEIVRKGIVHVPEGRRLFPQMTVEENLVMGAFRRRKDKDIRPELARVYELFPRLKERRLQKAGSLSGGEQQMCAIARGLMSDPRLLIIDEMSLGLAPVIVDDLVEILKEINSRGTAILLVEQDVQLALSNSHYGYVVATGRLVMEGPSEELLQSKEIKEAYLGM